MSLATACWWSLCRGIVIALLSLPVIHGLNSLLDQTTHCQTRRRFPAGLVWVGILIPFFVPELLVAYAYSNFSLSLIHFPWCNELLYSLLVFMKFMPVGVVVVRFAPPSPLSREAIHCCRLGFKQALSPIRRGMSWFGLWLRGPVRALFPAFAIVFLLAFQEFEMASLMGITTGGFHTPASWTVWLFDAHAGGLALSESLRLVLRPLFFETVILLPLLIVLSKSSPTQSQIDRNESPIRKGFAYCLFGYLFAAFALVCVIPMLIVLRGTISGAEIVLQNTLFLKEVLTAAGVAVTASVIAYLLTGWWLQQSWLAKSKFTKLITGIPAVVPGLCGSLIVSLMVLYAFQTSSLWRLYDTFVPLVLALVFFLLPRALVLQFLLQSMQPHEGMLLASLLKQSPVGLHQNTAAKLVWQLRTRGRFWSSVLLCSWSYWNLTPAALLSPANMASAPQRLYNLMHYGQTAVLSGMIVAAIVVPLLVLLLITAIYRPLLRWFSG